MSRLQLTIDQIAIARNYTLSLLELTPDADWFRFPQAGVSCIAWQVGHLAMAEYRLALERIRGTKPNDPDLISDAFLVQFGRDSKPEPGATKYPSQAEIRAVFERVHEQTLREIASLKDEELDLPVLKPHRLAKTRLESLQWCARHEAVHAGQIGLLRRQLGNSPMW